MEQCKHALAAEVSALVREVPHALPGTQLVDVSPNAAVVVNINDMRRPTWSDVEPLARMLCGDDKHLSGAYVTMAALARGQ